MSPYKLLSRNSKDNFDGLKPNKVSVNSNVLTFYSSMSNTYLGLAE